MENYKIRVNNEAESKEAQELFFELGYSWPGCEKYYNRIGNYTFITAYPDEMLLRMGWGGDTDKEITLPQLRDVVVLKRNDVKDANYRSKSVLDGFYFKSCDGVFYFMFEGKWVRSTINTDEGLEPIAKGSDLISGADALRALADGEEVEYQNKVDLEGIWFDITESNILDIFTNDRFIFRLKPQTVKLELELPKPFEPEEGEKYWWINPNAKLGYEWDTNDLERTDFNRIAMSVWRTEEEIKQVVEQLRKIRGAS